MSVALRIQHAKRMRHVVICGLPGRTTFVTLCHKQQYIPKSLLSTKCVSILSTTLFQKEILILRKWSVM